MADKFKKKAEESIVTDPILACEDEIDNLDALRAVIADLEKKEALLTENLCLAKEKGLTQQADKCRDLLQKVVLQRIKKQEDLKEAEARKLAAELDALTAKLEAEIDPAPAPFEETEEYQFLSKANRLHLISRMIGFVGVFACIIGALVYLLLSQPEVLNLPFNWIGLACVGCAALVFLIISLAVACSAKKYKLAAQLAEEERMQEEAEREAMEKEALLSIEHLNAAEQAYEIEKDLDIQKSKPQGKLFSKLKLPEQVPQKVKDNVHKIVPIAAACTAVVAAMAVSSSRKKAAEQKRSAAARRDFFKWLG